MSYNMLFEHNVPSRVERQWASRCPLLVADINNAKPDVIGSQELQSYQVYDFVKGTGYTRIGKSLNGSFNNTDRQENEAIFYNADVLEKIESGDFWFSSTPDEPSPADSMTYNRKCTWAKFQHKNSGKQFYVFNMHFYFEPDKDYVREQCANVLLSKLAELPQGYPVFLTGDFNSVLEDSCLVKIQNAGYRDSRGLVQNPEGPEYSYYDFGNLHEYTRMLDHIFVNSMVNVKSFRVDNSQMLTGKIESDHFPVIIKAEI